MAGALASLRGMGLVDDDGEGVAGQRADLLRDHRELLQGGDDDGLAALQRLLQLAGCLVDVLDHPEGLLELLHGPLELAVISRDHRTATAGTGTYIVYFGKDMNEAWLFDLPHKNGTHERPKPGARFKVDIIDTWDMTVQPYPEVFEVTSVINYRLYDKDFRKVRLPLKPYMALRISEAP